MDLPAPLGPASPTICGVVESLLLPPTPRRAHALATTVSRSTCQSRIRGAPEIFNLRALRCFCEMQARSGWFKCRRVNQNRVGGILQSRVGRRKIATCQQRSRLQLNFDDIKNWWVYILRTTQGRGIKCLMGIEYQASEKHICVAGTRLPPEYPWQKRQHFLSLDTVVINMFCLNIFAISGDRSNKPIRTHRT